MKLAEATWQDVQAFDREAVVLLPTGSLEQHGPHLPLFTDSILVTAVAEAVEAALPSQILMTPTFWLGASSHHLAFPGSLSATSEGYQAALTAAIGNLADHGFGKFYILNGHGGNTDLNSLVLREVKMQRPNLVLGHHGYFSFIPPAKMLQVLKGPWKHIKHACEAEASLMLHLRPDLVRAEKLRDDGFEVEPSVRGLLWHFNEIAEEGSLGYATLADAETGRQLFESAVEEIVREMQQLADGVRLASIPPQP